MYVNPTNTSVCEEISEVSANTICTKEDTAPGIPCKLDDNSVNLFKSLFIHHSYHLIHGNGNESLSIHLYVKTKLVRLKLFFS